MVVMDTFHQYQHHNHSNHQNNNNTGHNYHNQRHHNQVVVADHRLLDLWHCIDQLHLSYMEMEESSEKILHRLKLEDCIREYLYLTPNEQKYTFAETGKILEKSACAKSDFSGYKAATGWNAIQLYAGNLLAQPWRKEYRSIKTFCGFYKHQIEANLAGAELMFRIMGYRHYGGDGVLVLEGPICPDRVTSVSKDCLIAYVECQIIKSIWEEITPLNLTWLDVIEYRANQTSNIEQAVHSLSNNPQHQQQQRYQTISYPTHYQQQQQQHQNQPQTRVSIQLPLPIIAPTPTPATHNLQYMYNANGYSHNNNNEYHLYNHHHQNSVGIPPPPVTLKTTPFYNNHNFSNNNNSSSNANVQIYANNNNMDSAYPVPIGQLIELEQNQILYDCVDSGGGGGKSVQQPDENWDFVYRDLESQGYTKDLGERGDLLSPAKKRHTTQKTRRTGGGGGGGGNGVTNLDEAASTLISDLTPLKISEALERCCTEENSSNKQMKDSLIGGVSGGGGGGRASKSSSYDNLSNKAGKTPSKKQTEKASNAEHNLKKSSTVTVGGASMLDSIKRIKESKWECKTCTYLNDCARKICEMCNKTRRRDSMDAGGNGLNGGDAAGVGDEIEVGGAQCEKCTFVNRKDRNFCQACNASLKNSPTYI